MDENSEQGVILGAIFNDSTNPKLGGKGITRFQLSDNSVIEYDRNSHEYNLDIKGKINIKSDLEVSVQTLSAKITATSVAIIGNTAITGNLAVSGTLSGGGISASDGELTVKDVTADNGVKLKIHKHTGVTTGSGTSGIATP